MIGSFVLGTMTAKILCYILACYGLANLLVFGAGPFDMLEKIRKFAAWVHPTFQGLFSCMMCMPTQIGLFFSILNLLLFPSVPLTPFYLLIGTTSMWWLIIPLDMFFTSGCVWLIHTFQECLESITNRNNNGK